MKIQTAFLLAAMLATAACVPKSQYEQLQQQLETCERDKAAAQSTTADYSRQLDSERQRWDNIESNLNRAIPDALKSFEEQRTQILQAIPEESRKAVSKQMDRYFVNVTKQFDAMNLRIDELQAQLQQANSSLVNLKSTTEGVGQKVDEAAGAREAELKRERDKLQAELVATQKAVSDMANSIVSFDKERVNCDGCLTEIRFKKDGKEILSAFHADLVKKMNSL